MQLEFNENRPIFLQIAAWLKDAIVSGAFPEESQVPSITEFATSYRINPATALKGVNMLVDEGLLYKKRGLGMFVAPGARDKLLQERRQAFYSDFILPLLAEAERVRLGKTELIKLIERGYNEHGY